VRISSSRTRSVIEEALHLLQQQVINRETTIRDIAGAQHTLQLCQDSLEQGLKSSRDDYVRMYAKHFALEMRIIAMNSSFKQEKTTYFNSMMAENEAREIERRG
jgi:hypothetical protein